MKRLILSAAAGLMCITIQASAARFISHRGESAAYPENTMVAFRAAIDNGADGFELDARLTADNEIVVMHDATTTRTTDGSLTVASATLAQIRALDAGAWKGEAFEGERVPTLAEALSLARDEFEIYVEIKCGTEILPRLAQVMAAEPKATPGRVVFIAFGEPVIAALRQHATLSAYRAYLLSSDSSLNAAAMIAKLQSLNASGVNLQDFSGLTAGYVRDIQGAGFGFHTWTVNDQARAKALAALGVETITSDHGAAFALALGAPQDVKPLVHWTFDNGSGVNVGTGGSQYDAVFGGAVSFTNGVDGDALLFPAGLTQATRVYAALNWTAGNQGAIAFWFKPTRLFYNYCSLFDNSINNDNQWEAWIPSNGNVSFRVNSTTTTYGNLTTRHNGIDAWYHIVFTWDRDIPDNGQKVYVNGIFAAANTLGWVNPGGTFYFGAHHAGNPLPEGVMDDVRVYDNALTARQVRDLHAEIASKAPIVHITLDGTLDNIGTGGERYALDLIGDAAWTNGVNSKGQALWMAGDDESESPPERSYASLPYRLNRSATVAVWYYGPPRWANYDTVFDNSAHADRYECFANSGNQFSWRGGSATVIRTAMGAANSNRWWHICATWDQVSGSTVLYVNGEERVRGTDSGTTLVPGTEFFLGGGHSSNDRKGAGRWSDLQIFETALTPEQVAQVHAQFAWRTRFAERGGLVAYLPFEDGRIEDIAGSNAVTVTGSPRAGSPVFVKAKPEVGRRALAYIPDPPLSADPGSSSGGACVSVANALGSHAGTISMWYYARGPFYNYHPILDNAVHDEYWEGWIYSDGRLRIRVSNLTGGGAATCDLNNLRGPDSWYHIAWTWDRAACQTKLYVDGILRDTAALTDAGWVDPDPALNLGSTRPANRVANGIWDEVRVYDRALTAEEILDVMALPPPPVAKGTVIIMR
ncbi:MAG: hypothetical protein FWG50_02665 [Kiritimatiellaeota bacterium]|nr:hypothetical protein [Kiritimatiellota bacterium]